MARGFRTNATVFSKEMRMWAKEQVPKDHAEFTRKVGNATLKLLIENSPVAYGELRAGWAVGIGSRPPRPPREFDRYGSKALARGKAVLASIPPFKQIHFTNYTPQADIVEHGKFVPASPGPSKRGHPPGQRVGQVLVSGGFSTQAPRGVLGITLAAIRKRFGSP